MKKSIHRLKSGRNDTTDGRYYDCRLVLAFIALFVLFILFNLLISQILHIPFLMEWKKVGHNTWATAEEFHGPYLSSFRFALSFFEVFFSWLVAGILCSDKSSPDDEVSYDREFPFVIWTAALIGLPICINYISNPWIWTVYSLIMLVIAWVSGKRIGFALPVGKLLLKGFYKQSQDIDVDAGRYGRYHLKGHSSLWVIGFVLIGLFLLSLALFIAAYLNR